MPGRAAFAASTLEFPSVSGWLLSSEQKLPWTPGIPRGVNETRGCILQMWRPPDVHQSTRARRLFWSRSNGSTLSFTIEQNTPSQLLQAGRNPGIYSTYLMKSMSTC